MPRAAQPLAFRDLLERRLVVLLVGRGVERRPFVDQRLQVGGVVDLAAEDVLVDQPLVAEHGALAGVGQDDELVAEVAADRAGVGAHRDRLQAHAGEGAQVGDEHLVVGVRGARLVDVEGVVVLHQELAPAHDAEARPHLVAELPLDVIEVLRQVAVALHAVAEEHGDHLLVGRPEQHLAIVAVLEAQHLGAVGVVAAALAPQIGRLDGRHQHFLRARGVLLLAHDALDVAQHAQAERQPGIDAGAGLADQAGAQHQAVRHDLRLGRILLQGRQEILAHAHAIGVRCSLLGASPRAVCRSFAGARELALHSAPARTLAEETGDHDMLERVFKLTENKTNVKTELVAGLTTFLTMAYIIFVNPDILTAAGMPFGAVFTATCVAAAIGCLLMAFLANYPIALAPGMGLNAYFAFGVVGGMGHTWQVALGCVFLSGVIFLIISVLPIREWIVNAIPKSLKMAIAAGIGLFLALIALKNAGIVVGAPGHPGDARRARILPRHHGDPRLRADRGAGVPQDPGRRDHRHPGRDHRLRRRRPAARSAASSACRRRSRRCSCRWISPARSTSDWSPWSSPSCSSTCSTTPAP